MGLCEQFVQSFGWSSVATFTLWPRGVSVAQSTVNSMLKPRLSEMSKEIADLFRLNRRDARVTQQLFTEITVKEGAELAQEGSHQHQLVLILDGEVEVSKAGEVVATLRRGDVLGEITAIGVQTFQTATCVATKDSRIAVAGHQDLARVRDCTGLYLHLQHLTSKRTVGVS